MIKYLLKHGADKYVKDASGMSALDYGLLTISIL
jgi:hypothetical protein